MTVSDGGQAKIFLINILFGMACVLIFDLFRALRRHRAGSDVYANVLDALFFLTAFLLVLFASLKFNFGAMRYYQIFALAAGAFLQLALFSPFEVRLFEKMLAAGEKAIRFSLRLLLKPFVFALGLAAPLFLAFERAVMTFFSKISKKRIQVKRKRLQKKKILKKRRKMI